MREEKIGNAVLYCLDNSEGAQDGFRPDYGGGWQESGTSRINNQTGQHISQHINQIEKIVQSYGEADYHSQITAQKSWPAMYQLAETRANVIQWLQIPPGAKVLELGAGCGTLTGALLQKGASVTCQDEEPAYCRINGNRHSQASYGQLAIYAMPFAQCLPYLKGQYDIAFLIGVPLLPGEAGWLLNSVRGQLKPGGMLVLAADNKFGLKYWAGSKEPQTGKYFAGLENNGVHMYSKKGLEKLLQEAGFGQQQFYYPYPDYRFALEVYSDKYLPKKGDLTYNIANYEGDRLILFQEQKVFDSIIEEGQFPFFANSYLCLAWGGGELPYGQETFYARYAMDRSREFAACTEISAAGVIKRPAYGEGAAHIAHIEKAYRQLSCQYSGTGLQFNRCRLCTGENGAPYAQFELLHATALQEYLGQAIADGQIDAVYDMAHRLAGYIQGSGKKVPFAVTDSFTRVFGEIEDGVLDGEPCSEVSDIDLILPNILVGEDGAWNVIDYEWTFFFPVPHHFIIYRTLFFLSLQNPGNKELALDALLQDAGITPKEAQAYAKMEQGFQQYVAGGLVPYREMVNVLGRRYLDVAQLKAEYDIVVAQNERLRGQGFWKAARKIKKKLTGN